ncbi:hypothetical protein AB0C33_37135 [Nonomuraea sp. NPDC048881]|uniref:hypothetical protein n=1 Tax=Nonomuraea sp. NPDC048881 TaxID=3155030 RepID=UPI0033FFB459
MPSASRTTIGRRALALLALTAATGCLPFPTTPSFGGLTGVTVNADGRLTLVMAWCARPPDGVVVYRKDDGTLVDQARLTAPPLPGALAYLDLEKLPPGWSLAEGDLRFRRKLKYKAAGYDAKRNARMYDVVFDAGSRKKVRPGQVIITEHKEAEKDGHDVLLSTAEFTARVRYYC